MKVEIRQVVDDAGLVKCHAIRTEVFIVEQSVLAEEEMDGHDAAATHFLALADGEIAGTARLRVVDGMAKLERIAVRKPYRGVGVGRALVEHMLQVARGDPALTHAKLGAQVRAMKFYESLGFEGYGEEYLDARIPHRWMKRAL